MPSCYLAYEPSAQWHRRPTYRFCGRARSGALCEIPWEKHALTPCRNLMCTTHFMHSKGHTDERESVRYISVCKLTWTILRKWYITLSNNHRILLCAIAYCYFSLLSTPCYVSWFRRPKKRTFRTGFIVTIHYIKLVILVVTSLILGQTTSFTHILLENTIFRYPYIAYWWITTTVWTLVRTILTTTSVIPNSSWKEAQTTSSVQ